MIIGLTGRNASGKGVVADFLRERSFGCYSLSDALREDLKRRNIEPTRANLIREGVALRERFGPGVLAQRVIQWLDPNLHYVVDSFRHPAEVEVFRSRPDFTLFNIEAPEKLRWNRLRKRKRPGDPRTFDAFKSSEAKELVSGNASAQQLIATAKLADHTIRNDGKLKDLHARAQALAQKLLLNEKRPGWDSYFMGIAQVVARRSNCMKRKIAALIVKNGRIISTGYNGTPRGVKNCNEGGCPRCNALASHGTKLDECLCSHGEENAIVQAAYHGIAIAGGTLYTTYSPCLLCSKMIINAGIREVVYNNAYPLGDRALALLKEAGVVVRKV